MSDEPVHVVAETFKTATEGEMGFSAVRVGDVWLTAERHRLIDVKYEADGTHFSTVTIRLQPTSFTTSPRAHNDPSAAADAETALERALEQVLIKYGVPAYGLPMRCMIPPAHPDDEPDLAAVREMMGHLHVATGKADRGDMASDLADAARKATGR